MLIDSAHSTHYACRSCAFCLCKYYELVKVVNNVSCICLAASYLQTGMQSLIESEYKIPYFLKISPHLEIPPPSKSRRTYKEIGSNKHRPQNLAAWKRVVGFKVCGIMVECRRTQFALLKACSARWVSGLVATLKISLRV